MSFWKSKTDCVVIMMTRYPKIDTIWKRDEKNKYNIMEGRYSKEEFESINMWHITEKIDGMNIRIIFSQTEDLESSVEFQGRTDNAQIPAPLMNYLIETFTPEKMDKAFEKRGESTSIVLYAEGYGAKIQAAGKKYREDNAVILFDVKISHWWLEPPKVKEIANKLGINCVPNLGVMTTNEAINFVKSKQKSKEAEDSDYIMEGIVARSYPLMLFRDGKPIMWKLKVKDYERLEN